MFEQTFKNIDDILYKDAGADSELDKNMKTFQGLVLWHRHHSEGRYHLAGGLRPFRALLCSPKGAIYTNVGYSPAGKNMKTFQGLVSWHRHHSEGRYHLAGGLRPFRALLCSPKGAIYTNVGDSPADKNMKTFQGLVLWHRHHSEGRYHLAGGLRPFRALLCSPKGAIYTNVGYSPAGKNKKIITSPEWAQ